MRNLTTAEFDQEVQSAPLAMVDFWADWCRPLQDAGPHGGGPGGAVRRQGPGRQDQRGPGAGAGRRFGIMSIPTVVFLKNGVEVDRKVGVMPPAVFAQVLDQNL